MGFAIFLYFIIIIVYLFLKIRIYIRYLLIFFHRVGTNVCIIFLLLSCRNLLFPEMTYVCYGLCHFDLGVGKMVKNVK